jgi:hypothetical protein
MKRNITSLIILAAVAGLPVVAAPLDAPTSASASGRDLAGLENRWALPLTFNSFDANKDGFISRQEAATSPLLASQFAQLDKDGDGRLSPEELGAAISPEVAASAAAASRGESSRGN